jgi:hypothetical protein
MGSRGISRAALAQGASHEGFLRHKRFRWLKIASLLCFAAGLGYALIDVQPRPYGGSAYGYALGIVSTLLILWLTLLGVRKRAMTPGKWSLKGWTSAHVYLGLSLIVLATLHTGFQFGWNVHTLAYGLMLLVIASGVYGIIAYAVLPAQLSNSRADMTKPQMIDAVTKLDAQLQAAAQPLSQRDAETVRLAIDENAFGGGLLRRVSGRHQRCRTARALRALRERSGVGEGDLQAVMALLERKCAALEQIRRHLRIRALIEIWLYAHVPLTFALIAALGAHILSVFFYW